MDPKSIDARGLTCPEPVILVRKAILAADCEQLQVLVDEDVAAENITRLATKEGWKSSVDRSGDVFRLVLSKSPATATDPTLPTVAPRRARPTIAVLVASNLVGRGDEQLGQILMRAFIKTLKELDPLPTTLAFINSGVRLTTTGSEVLGDLQEISARGVQILSCGICLNFYGLADSLQVGVVSNMFEVVSALAAANRTINP